MLNLRLKQLYHRLFIKLSLEELSLSFFFFNDTATTEIYTLSLHDALPIAIRTRALTWFTTPADRPTAAQGVRVRPCPTHRAATPRSPRTWPTPPSRSPCRSRCASRARCTALVRIAPASRLIRRSPVAGPPTRAIRSAPARPRPRQASRHAPAHRPPAASTRRGSRARVGRASPVRTRSSSSARRPSRRQTALFPPRTAASGVR